MIWAAICVCVAILGLVPNAGSSERGNCGGHCEHSCISPQTFLYPPLPPKAHVMGQLQSLHYHTRTYQEVASALLFFIFFNLVLQVCYCMSFHCLGYTKSKSFADQDICLGDTSQKKKLSLFTVRRELHSKWSNLNWRIDLVYSLKSQQNPVDMAGFYSALSFLSSGKRSSCPRHLSLVRVNRWCVSFTN